MPKRRLNVKQEGPFHIVDRCINKEWFNIPMPEVWEIFSLQLNFCKFAFNVKIHSFVLMSNHYHMLISTPDYNLSEFMAYFKRETSRALNKAGNRINGTFASRYKPSLLNSYHYFLNAYKYAYQNPLRAGLVDKVEDYPFSTLSGLLGQCHLMIPVESDELLFEGNMGDHLKWLNKLPEEKNLESMRLGLTRGIFKLRKDPQTSRPNNLEVDLF